jgi:hypothetical protein
MPWPWVKSIPIACNLCLIASLSTDSVMVDGKPIQPYLIDNNTTIFSIKSRNLNLYSSTEKLRSFVTRHNLSTLTLYRPSHGPRPASIRVSSFLRLFLARTDV